MKICNKQQLREIETNSWSFFVMGLFFIITNISAFVVITVNSMIFLSLAGIIFIGMAIHFNIKYKNEKAKFKANDFMEM